VGESKKNTGNLLEELRAQGKFSEQEPLLESDGLRFYSDAATRERVLEPGAAGLSPEGVLSAFLSQARPGDYLALMAYLEPNAEHTAALQSVRVRLRDSLCLATTLGYGPRFLHSTGQFHKGGPNNGLFIQITADDAQDLPIPGEPYSFSILKQAQALGDLRSLESKQRRVVRLHVGKDVSGQLARLEELVESAVKL
jgi:hypothetical protein